jgi:hypothetical protein
MLASIRAWQVQNKQACHNNFFYLGKRKTQPNTVQVCHVCKETHFTLCMSAMSSKQNTLRIKGTQTYLHEQDNNNSSMISCVRTGRAYIDYNFYSQKKDCNFNAWILVNHPLLLLLPRYMSIARNEGLTVMTINGWYRPKKISRWQIMHLHSSHRLHQVK